MRLKLDENLPSSLVGLLQADGHDVDTVQDENLGGATDEVVLATARMDARVLVTQDLDFVDWHRRETHPGLIILRLAMPGARAASEHLRRALASPLASRFEGALVVVTETKIRVRPAPASSG